MTGNDLALMTDRCLNNLIHNHKHNKVNISYKMINIQILHADDV